jgi:uncharacterized membrane protein
MRCFHRPKLLLTAFGLTVVTAALMFAFALLALGVFVFFNMSCIPFPIELKTNTAVKTGDWYTGGQKLSLFYRSAGVSPVCFAIRAGILGPISSPSWNTKT